LTDNIEILRARAERFRRLADDLLDPRTSEEAANLAQELDAEIARLLTAPRAGAPARCH
jgi:plasmid stabilization system protein ParE